MNYRSEINKQMKKKINENPMQYQKSSFIPPTFNYSNDIPYYNNFNNYNNFYNNSSNSSITQSPQPRPSFICPMPSIPDEKPINRQNISIIKENIPFIKYIYIYLFILLSCFDNLCNQIKYIN